MDAKIDTHQENEQIKQVVSAKYEAGFVTKVDSEQFPPGLNEDVIKAISAKKDEPQWLLEWRLESFQKWQDVEATWSDVDYIDDYQSISYYAAPNQKKMLLKAWMK